MAHMWKPEDNCVDLVLKIFAAVSWIKLRLQNQLLYLLKAMPSPYFVVSVS